MYILAVKLVFTVLEKFLLEIMFELMIFVF